MVVWLLLAQYQWPNHGEYQAFLSKYHQSRVVTDHMFMVVIYIQRGDVIVML